MIHRRPFVTAEKSPFHLTLQALLVINVFSKQIKMRGQHLPYTKFRRKKKWKLTRKHQWLPLVAFFSDWVIQYRWQSAEIKGELFFLLYLPAPVSLRVHHALNRIKRDVEVLYMYFNSNKLHISFLPARYLDIGHRQTQIHQGFSFLRNAKMYTLYSEMVRASELSNAEFTKAHEFLQTSELVPLVVYYAVTEWIPIDFNDKLKNEATFAVFDNFNKVSLALIASSYHIIVLLHIKHFL